jgi:hypothetical protein
MPGSDAGPDIYIMQFQLLEEFPLGISGGFPCRGMVDVPSHFMSGVHVCNPANFHRHHIAPIAGLS